MIGHGRGSINTKIKRYHEAGEHEAKAKMLLDSSIDDVEKAARRTPLTTVKNQLNKVAATQRLVSKTLSVTGKTWQKTARCDAAVQGRLSAQLVNGLTMEGLEDNLQRYVAGPTESSGASPMQDMSGGMGQGALVDAPYMNTRPKQVKGWTLELPKGQSFLQMSDAVAKMIEVRKAPDKKMRTAGYAIWQSWCANKWFDVSYTLLCTKVRQVLEESESSRSQGLSLDQIIQKHCSRVRTEVDKPAPAGRQPFLTPDEFTKRVKDQTRGKKSAGKNVVMSTLSEAKAAYHAARGLHARSEEVDAGTYARYMQFTGGDDLLLRAKVHPRSHARQAAAHSEMHALAHAFTIMDTHILPAPTGMGIDPPESNWAARMTRDFIGMPVRPVRKALILNSDSKTFGCRLQTHPDRDLQLYVVSKDNTRKETSYYTEISDRDPPWLFLSTHDLMDGNGKCGQLFWVRILRSCTGAVCVQCQLKPDH